MTSDANSINSAQGLEAFEGGRRTRRRNRPGRTIQEAARDTEILSETDVLVIGGGPAGTAAALSAARLGAEVTLVERYNHLGGLSTGGLVIWIDRMSDWTGKQVIGGFAADVFDRLPREAVMGPPRADWGSRDVATAGYWAQRSAAYHGTVTWSPTIDPEALKTLSMNMVVEQKVKLLLHSYAVQPIVEDDVVRGVIFESKQGRMAILSKVVIDTTGDADILVRAGTAFESDTDPTDIHHCLNTAFLLGGVDMNRWLDFRYNDKAGFAAFMQRGRDALTSFEKPFSGWRNDIALFMGPRLSGYSATDVEDLTEVELQSRRLTVGHLDMYRRHAPGFEAAFLMLGAPQVGVRHSRRIAGRACVRRADWENGGVAVDEIGVSPSLTPKIPNVSVPYGALVPAGLNGVLAAGRHISCDARSHTFLREIPQCWLTGQAAGVAAALAADGALAPAYVEPAQIQRELLKQGACLSPSVTALHERSSPRRQGGHGQAKSG
jgi:hypothetical protein